MLSMFCSGASRFTDFGFYRSALVVILLMGTMVVGFLIHEPILPAKETKKFDGDLVLYQRIVEKIHSGTGYYDAAGYELRKMGYTARSVFNWRLPTLAWFLGHLPSLNTGRILAVIFTSAVLLIWLTVFHQCRYPSWQVLLGGLILSGSVVYSMLPGPFLSHEFWAGSFISLSLAANARGWHGASVLSGLLALFLRELALPFVCTMVVLSYASGQRRESLWWFMGVIAFGIMFFLHWSIVSKLVLESDQAIKGGWIVFGGWPFILHTAQTYPYLLIAPSWLTVIVLPLSLLGLAGWRGSLGIRVACTVGIYVLAYFIVGRSLNKYWGLMYSLVMPLGLLHVPSALTDLAIPIKKKITEMSS